MMKKGKWSKEEDNLIKNHIQKYGVGRSWQALSSTLGLQRCGRSCRSRWLNYLRPGLKHGNFTATEERIICEMYSKRGSCWSFIAAHLPGRTDLAIKNYWNSTLKKKFPAARTSAAYRRQNRPASSTSSDAGTPARDLQLVCYSGEESSTAGSNAAKPLMACPTPVQAAPSPVPVVAAGQEPVAAIPASGTVRIEKKQAVVSLPRPAKTPPATPPACDQTGEKAMGITCAPVFPAPLSIMKLEELPCIYQFDDIACAPMSPVPLSIMEPDPLPITYEFDDIDSFFPWFDQH